MATTEQAESTTLGLSKSIVADFISLIGEKYVLVDDSQKLYSWWSYRANAREKNLGWRIDYNMVTDNLKNKLKRSVILPEAKHSDHCPVVLEIDF